MTTDAILFESSALPDDARVLAFRAREALNRPYEVEVWLSTAKGDEVDLEDALFAPALLTVDPQDSSPESRGAERVQGVIAAIEQHPRTALNQKYLVLATERTGIEPSADRAMVEELTGLAHEDLQRVTADLLATSVEYKPLTKTAWPRIHSHELGVVDGPADSEYAQIDDQGRYKVKCLFDEGDGEAGKASTWVRMMQPHGGNPEGIHFPLRKGTQVVLSFLGGDPDRPIIAGAVPTPEPPSQVTSGNNTRNVIRTGANNYIEMEDTKGKEWIHTSTPNKNTHIHMGEPRTYEGSEAHYAEHTDGNGHCYVGGDHTDHIVGNLTEKYDAKKKLANQGIRINNMSAEFNSGAIHTFT